MYIPADQRCTTSTQPKSPLKIRRVGVKSIPDPFKTTSFVYHSQVPFSMQAFNRPYTLCIIPQDRAKRESPVLESFCTISSSRIQKEMSISTRFGSTVYQPDSVHLVGSAPFESAKDVFTKAAKALRGRLERIPDGETERGGEFIAWQRVVFPTEEVWGPMHRNPQPEDRMDLEFTVDDMKPTKYDEFAVKNYAVFRQLKEEGVIPSRTRFQVCIPSPIDAIWVNVRSEYLTKLQPLYTERLLKDLWHLQDVIPASELAIQIDCAIEFALLECDRGRFPEHIRNQYFFFEKVFGPKRIGDHTGEADFPPVKEYLLDAISKVSAAVDKEVQLGYHLCYGDLKHEHFIQPEDSGLLVEMANSLAREIAPKHPIHWIHMPVPKDRSDEAYFKPLKDLNIGDTKLILGLVHAHDKAGTVEKVRLVQAIYPLPFGVATECGLGRTPLEDIDSIFAIARHITAAGVPE